ncbi:hypothetical protein LJ707_20000 [Mucilaginibacter sp. UR6-1]|uniref:hypothetical protein n=1 Tax=Mucilaginibacter sp. UR6-1 TaxID=1435643 RepID=UPI001E349462|nr:hypothetical protein [Mucilaginibacter sp. UR6-1]MCC8411234.1 hypothetical protein [Mucilaginibacter sp. UR6-1]
MKKLAFIIFILFNLNYCSAQKPGTNSQVNQQQILSAVHGFLKWYKVKGHDTTVHYRLIKGGAPDSTTRPSINWDGVETYLAHLNSSGYVSPAYLNTHREHFKEVDKELEGFKLTSELIKINGLDFDLVLKNMEPEDVLDNLNKMKLHKLYVIDDKAMAAYTFTRYVCMIFTLTKENDKWLIDYIGWDRSH